MEKETIIDKDMAYKISFKSDSQRNRAIKELKLCGFEIVNNFDNECCYMFTSTFDNLRLASWDNKRVYQEKETNVKRISFLRLLELCKG